MVVLSTKEFVRLEILKALIASGGKGADDPNKKLSYNANSMANVILKKKP